MKNRTLFILGVVVVTIFVVGSVSLRSYYSSNSRTILSQKQEISVLDKVVEGLRKQNIELRSSLLKK